MDNHVHFLLVPLTGKALARLFLRVHTGWAMYVNAETHRSGHLFQGRFHSCVLDETHYWTALRYIETNPRNANITHDLAAFEHSSAAHHLAARADPFFLLMMDAWHRRFIPASYLEFLERTGPAVGTIGSVRSGSEEGQPVNLLPRPLPEFRQTLSASEGALKISAPCCRSASQTRGSSASALLIEAPILPFTQDV